MRTCVHSVGKYRWLILLLLVVGTSSMGRSQPSRKLDYVALLDTLMRDFPTPGVAVAVYREGQWTEYLHGCADLTSQDPITSSSVFNVASISKLVTSLAVMLLVEREEVDLESPIEKYLGGWTLPPSRFDSRAVTVGRVLDHSAGLSREFGPGFGPSDSLMGLRDILAGRSPARRQLQVVYEPGTSHMYSNLGYGLLQLLVEEVSGQDFGEFVKETVFDRLNMSRSSFADPAEAHSIKDLVSPHDHRLQALHHERFVVKAAAGLLSNLQDLERLVEEEIDRSKLLTSSSYRKLHTADSSGMAFGHMVLRSGSENLSIGHTGLGMGWNSSLQVSPNSQDGIIVLTNGDNGFYIHNMLVGYWIYARTGIPTRLLTVGPDKKLNWIDLYLEISAERRMIDRPELDSLQTTLAGLRQHLKVFEIEAFRSGCAILQSKLRRRIADPEIQENFDKAFASCFYWTDMPWFKMVR